MKLAVQPSLVTAPLGSTRVCGYAAPGRGVSLRAADFRSTDGCVDDGSPAIAAATAGRVRRSSDAMLRVLT